LPGALFTSAIVGAMLRSSSGLLLVLFPWLLVWNTSIVPARFVGQTSLDS